MQEGTYPAAPVKDSSIETSGWSTESSVFNNQKSADSEIDSPKIESNPLHDGHGYGSPHFSKKLIKLGIGLFVIFTIILSVLTFISSRLMSPAREDVTLTYWGLAEDESVMKPVIEEFEKENPNIKIDYIRQDPVDYRERLEVRSRNGNGPDIFSYHNTWYPMVSNLLLPLASDVIDRSQFESSYYDVAQNDLIKNGAIYGIPLQTDTLALFVNTQIFEQAAGEIGEDIPVPTTWQEFINTATTLTKRDDSGVITIGGAGIGTFANVNHAPDIISLLFAQNGVDLTDLSGSGENITDALRFYTNFANVENNVWDGTQDSAEIAFAQGKLAMYFGYSQDYFKIKALNPNIQMKVVPVPQLVMDDKVNVASYWVEGVSSESKNPVEAQIFMKFLAKPETQEKIYTEASKTREFGQPYSNKNLAGKLQGSDFFVFVDQSKTALSSPFITGTGDKGLNEELNNLLRNSVNSLLSNTSEGTILEEFLVAYPLVIEKYSGLSKK